MEYRLENQRIQLNESNKIKISDGNRKNLYRYQGQFIEVYPEDVDTSQVLDESTTKYFSTISTHQILLPKKSLYSASGKKFCGFSFRYVGKKGSSKKIINSPIMGLIRNVQMLEGDIETISNRKILLSQLSPEQTLFNGDYLFLTDPKKYSLLENVNSEDLRYLNEYQLYLLLSELILVEMRKDRFDSSVIQQTKELITSKDLWESTSNFFSDLLKDNKNIKQFVKKI